MTRAPEFCARGGASMVSDAVAFTDRSGCLAGLIAASMGVILEVTTGITEADFISCRNVKNKRSAKTGLTVWRDHK